MVARADAEARSAHAQAKRLAGQQSDNGDGFPTASFPLTPFGPIEVSAGRREPPH
jgi:hypothetical protein